MIEILPTALDALHHGSKINEIVLRCGGENFSAARYKVAHGFVHRRNIALDQLDILSVLLGSFLLSQNLLGPVDPFQVIPTGALQFFELLQATRPAILSLRVVFIHL